MSGSPSKCRVAILVKALPQPSKRYGETVCCAGISDDGHWKRLYPVRFRHLSGESSFARWDIVEFNFSSPITDRRKESCRVHEETIKILGSVNRSSRSKIYNRFLVSSIAEAAVRGDTLALLRPRNPKFIWKAKSIEQLAGEKAAYSRAASQGSLLDKELETLEPSPYQFRFQFSDSERSHDYANGDWEAHAMYYGAKRRGKSDLEILQWMDHVFNHEYPSKGMVFAVGNQAKRPQVWQLLGVIRLDPPREQDEAQGILI